jgi:hypothetical protein
MAPITNPGLFEFQILPPEATRPINIGYAETNVPGISNVVIAPINMIWSLRQIAFTTSIDREGFNEAVLHLTACFAGLAHAVESLVPIINGYIHTALENLFLPIHITASFLCFIELILESFRTVRTILFRNQFVYSPQQYQCLKSVIDVDQVEKLFHLIKSNLESWKKVLPDETLKQLENDLAGLKGELELHQKPQDASLVRNPLSTQVETASTEPSGFERAKSLQNRVNAVIQYKNLYLIERDYFSLSKDDEARVDQMKRCEETGQTCLGVKVAPGSAVIRQQRILEGKSVQLARRVQPWLYNEITFQKNDLLAQLKDIIENPIPQGQLDAIESTKKLFAKIDKQMFKTLVIHTVALVAIGLITTGVILSFLSFPVAIPLYIGIAGSTLATIASFSKACTLPAEDWRFCPSYLLPTWLRPYFCLQRLKSE